MLRNLIVALGAAAALFCGSSSAMADASTLYLGVPEKEFEEMGSMISDLEFNSITVEHVDPKSLDSIKSESFVAIHYTPGSPAAEFLKGKISAEDEAEIAKPGGKKLVILTNPFAEEQEWIVWAGNTDEDADQLRRSKRNSWWNLIANWFGMPVNAMKQY